jgi:hypothetical protein
MASLAGLAMLSAGTSNLNRLGGGKRSTVREDLMCLLGKVSDHAFDYAALKYMLAPSMDEVLACSTGDTDKMFLPNDPEAIRRVRIMNKVMWVEAGRLARKHKWKPRDVKTLVRLAELALAESIGDPRCKCCNGTGERMAGATVGVCRRCDGSGNRRITGRSYADMIGIDEKAWRTTWSDRYWHLQQVCDAWRAEVAAVLWVGSSDERVGIC